jgi:photosystem II stability/assembly factor-like uncharacterized protein
MKTSRFLFCSLTAILPLLSAPLRAGTNRWTGSGPDHATVTQIVADAGVAYAVIPGAGIYKTTNGGQRWRPANEGLLVSSGVTALVETDDALTLYAANGDAIYASNDGAEHWSFQGRPDVFGPASVLAFDSLSRMLYAGSSSHSGVFRSEDGGRTWQQSSGLNLIIRSLAVLPNGITYAVGATFPPAAGETLFRSVDHGATWTVITTSPSAEAVAVESTGSTIYVLGTGIVSFSADEGKSWKALPRISGAAFATSIVPLGDGRLYASTNLGVYEYTDRSGAWRTVGTGISDAFVGTLATTSSIPRRLYAAKESGLVTTLEGAADWVTANRGLPGSNASDVAAILLQPGRAYGATSRGVFKTDDHGQSWSRVQDGPTMRHVATNPSDPDTVYASGDGIVKTTDGGATWKSIKPDHVNVLAVAPSDRAAIYASFADQMSKSLDGGSSWRFIGTGLPLLPDGYGYFYLSTSSIAVDPSDASTAYLGQPDGIYKTSNGGSNWLRTSPAGLASALAIDPSAPSVVYAALYPGGISKSYDGGTTWINAGLDGESITTLAIDPTNTSIIYAGTLTGNVYRTASRGSDWTLYGVGLRGAAVYNLAIEGSGDDLYAATAAGVFEYERDRRLDAAATYRISLRSYSGNFVTANDCGDGAVTSNADAAGPCESFTLCDVSGLALMDGDQVYLRVDDGSFMSAENGGSNGCEGCPSPVNANRAFAGPWETFTIHKMNGTGPIAAGDAVSLQSSAGNYVAAENGGANGCKCDSPLNANRLSPREWETFVISIH